MTKLWRTAHIDLQCKGAVWRAEKDTNQGSININHPGLSDTGVPTQKISDLIGHHDTTVTETVYRHQLQPVIENGAERMQDIFTCLMDASA